MSSHKVRRCYFYLHRSSSNANVSRSIWGECSPLGKGTCGGGTPDMVQYLFKYYAGHGVQSGHHYIDKKLVKFFGKSIFGQKIASLDIYFSQNPISGHLFLKKQMATPVPCGGHYVTEKCLCYPKSRF